MQTVLKVTAIEKAPQDNPVELSVTYDIVEKVTGEDGSPADMPLVTGQLKSFPLGTSQEEMKAAFRTTLEEFNTNRQAELEAIKQIEEQASIEGVVGMEVTTDEKVEEAAAEPQEPTNSADNADTNTTETETTQETPDPSTESTQA